MRRFKEKTEENKNKTKKRKNKKVAKLIILLLIILLIVGTIFVVKRVKDLGGGLRGVTAMILGHNKDTLENLDTFYCLVMGESEGLTDTIMLVAYSPKKGEASILSIPRDTFTGTNQNTAGGYDKINSLYRGTSKQKKDAQRTVDAVSKITGVEIPYYAVIDTKGVRQMVDLLGGVYFDVPINMKYNDYSQKLHIDLKKGYQLLNGDQAEQLLRFRHNNDSQGRITTTYPAEYGVEDEGRMRTQREFITAMMKQTLKVENVTKINKIIDIMHENLVTNIDIQKIKDYVPYAIDFNTEKLNKEQLPGKPVQASISGTWLYVHDKKETESIVKRLFLDLDDVNESSKTDETEESSIIKNKGDLKIEILNGSKNKDVLAKLNKKLSDKGYNIIKADSTNNTAKTTIINRTKIDDTLVNDLKKTVEIGSISTGDKSDNVDITIIIGNDYK